MLPLLIAAVVLAFLAGARVQQHIIETTQVCHDPNEKPTNER